MDRHVPAAASLSGLAARDIADIMTGCARIAPALSGARVLVTGASGWFGTWLLDALVALDVTYALDLAIVAVSREPRQFARRHPRLARASAITWLAGDVRDARFAVPGDLTHVIHAATDASATLNAASPDLMFDTIVAGTRNVLGLAARAGATRALLTSSGAVYGPQPPDVARLDERRRTSDPLAVPNAYAEGKRAAERIATEVASERGLETAIARCFAFVGPHMPFDAHFAVGNFIRDALEGDAIVVAGDGTSARSYLYMTDLVVWLLTMLVEAPAKTPYNVGSPDAITVGDLARRCAATAHRVAGRNVAVHIENRARGGASYVPAIDRAGRELGLVASVGLDDAIERTMTWRRGSVAAPVMAAGAVP
jgi:nucleoside-diphosphate-sugar epimerase